MASNKIMRIGPVALTTTLTTNILNAGAGARATPPVGFTDTVQYIVIRRISVTNKTGSAATVSLWIGASAGNVAGTEYEFQAFSVAANSNVTRYVTTRLDSADFLVGGAGTATALTLEMDCEFGVSG